MVRLRRALSYARTIEPVKVKVPKVRPRTGKPVVFHSSLVPPYVRRAGTLDAALYWLYLKGISTGQMGQALEVPVGPEARGLPGSVVGRLKRQGQDEYNAWRKRPRGKDRCV